MGVMIWVGAVLALAGLAGILGCILSVVRARRRGLDDAAMRAHMQRIVAWNLGSLAISALGLMAVVAGIVLG